MSAQVIHFEKWQGLGNDFILIDQSLNPTLKLNADLARRLCDRHYGIGADQILHLTRPMSPVAMGRMDLWNADGETSEMCGNGVRAIAFYVAEKKFGTRAKIPEQTVIPIEVMNRVYPITLSRQGARVDMGPPLKLNANQTLASPDLTFTEVNMGNPHAVIELPFSIDLEELEIEKMGPWIEHHDRFPNRTNVEWMWVENRTNIHMRVWERGAGVTLACGSGACAVTATAISQGKVDKAVTVHLPGGALKIEWSGIMQDSVWMTGPASKVFAGDFSA